MHAQNSGRVIYKKKISLETDNPNINEGKLQNSINQLNYILDFSHGESLFYLEDQLINDSDPYAVMAKRIGGGNGSYYKNAISEITLHHIVIFDSEFLVNINLPAYKITKQYKIIKGFKAYKATFEKTIKAPNPGLKDLVQTVEVWFAPELAIPFGPLEYNGLPGLVLQASINNVTYSIEDINFYKNNNPKIAKPISGINLTEKEFGEKLKEIVKNFN